MKNTKISACIVIHNEEKLLDRCLNSLKDVVEEIIIVHDGKCTDNSLNIAKKYADVVYIRDKIGVAEPHRFFLYERAKYDWILQIDADEYLSDDMKNDLYKLRDLYPNQMAFSFFWPLWDGKKYITKKGPYKIAFFNKKAIEFIGLPHEHPHLKSGRVIKIKSQLEHRPLYNNQSLKFFIKKQIKWIKITANLIVSDFKYVNKYNYSENDWPNRIKYKADFSFITMFLLPIYNYFFSINSYGIYNLRSYKPAFYRSLYTFMLYGYLTKIKVKNLFLKNIEN